MLDLVLGAVEVAGVHGGGGHHAFPGAQPAHQVRYGGGVAITLYLVPILEIH